VANPGGLGNTRQDLDAASGPPAGETPEHLVVYRKNNVEYHVGFTPAPPRAELVLELAPSSGPWTLEAAMAEARKLFPRDTQPRAAGPEGNDQFVVERFASPSLGQVIGADQFATNHGQPGQFLAVYAREPNQSGRISRLVVGIGDDPNVLLAAK
jgi:hypothetical protein